MLAPSTPILDDFNRANQDPIASGWAQFYPGLGQLRVLSNQMTHQAAGLGPPWGSYWTTAFGPDMECYATLVTKASGTNVVNLYVRSLNAGTASLDAYVLFIYNNGTNDVMEIYKEIDGGTDILISSSVTVTITDGDKFWFRVVGNQLTGYQQKSGQNWIEQVSASNSDYAGVGYVGSFMAGNAVWDDFGGGTVSLEAEDVPILSWLGR